MSEKIVLNCGLFFCLFLSSCNGYQSQIDVKVPILYDSVTQASSNAFEKFNGCYEFISPREDNHQYSVLFTSNKNSCVDKLGETQVIIKKYLDQKEVQTTILEIPIFQKGQFLKNNTVLRYDYFGSQNSKCITDTNENYIQQILIVQQSAEQIFTSYKAGFCEKTYGAVDCSELIGKSKQFVLRKSVDCSVK